MKKILIIIAMAAAAIFAASAAQPSRGYRGFLEVGLDAGSQYGFRGYSQPYFYWGFSTTHGHQFNPHLFIGGGLNIEADNLYGRGMFAVYAAGRTDWRFGRVSPFGDLRIGWNMDSGGGLYFSPTIGHRFNWFRGCSFDLGIGLTLKTRQTNRYSFTELPDGTGLIAFDRYGTATECLFALRVGIEFGKSNR